MRIALVGVSHWHVPTYLLIVLQELKAEIVAISDPSPEALARIGSGLSASQYRDYRQLLDNEAVDLVLAHAPHNEMTDLAAELVARHQPFHMEKPMGIDWRKLAPVAAQAETEQVFTSVALVSRYHPVVEKLAELQQAGELGQVCHYYYRLLAGGPQRYMDWGCEWMLDPSRAGGGPLFNFGPHVVDTFIYLAGQKVVEVSAHFGTGIHDVAIEDLVSLTMIGEEGAIGVAEAGYVLPSGYERYFSLTTDTLHYGGQFESGTILMRDGRQVLFSSPDEDESYFRYTGDLLDCLASGRPPRASIQDMVVALQVINAAAESARTGKPVKLDSLTY